MARVASATSSTSLALAGNRSRLMIENSDANRLHVLLGSGTAATDDYSFSLAQNENAEIVGYKGAVKGIWAGDGSGYAHVTEL